MYSGIPFCGGGGYWADGKGWGWGWAMASGGAGASWFPCIDRFGQGQKERKKPNRLVRVDFVMTGLVIYLSKIVTIM